MKKKGRKPEPRGAKLHDNAKLELVVVKWLTETPSISDLAISKKLLSEYKFKFSAPSVKAWRDNFYPHISEDIRKKMEEQVKESDEQTRQISFQRIEYLKELKGLVDTLTLRIETIKSQLPNMDEEVPSSTLELNIYLEAQYESLIKSKGALLKQIVELLGPEDLSEKYEEVLKRTLKVCIDSFRNYVPKTNFDACLRELQSNVTTLQRQLREDLLII